VGIRGAAGVWRLSQILLHYDLKNNVYKLSANKHRRSFATERGDQNSERLTNNQRRQLNTKTNTLHIHEKAAATSSYGLTKTEPSHQIYKLHP
jgi:hypothetical protein